MSFRKKKIYREFIGIVKKFDSTELLKNCRFLFKECASGQEQICFICYMPAGFSIYHVSVPLNHKKYWFPILISYFQMNAATVPCSLSTNKSRAAKLSMLTCWQQYRFLHWVDVSTDILPVFVINCLPVTRGRWYFKQIILLLWNIVNLRIYISAGQQMELILKFSA